MSRVRVAAAAWQIERVASFEAWRARLAHELARAADEGAGLAVVPEYASMELTSLLPDEVRADLRATLAAMQRFLPLYRQAYAELARAHRLVVVAGSFPEAVGDGYVNRARVFGAGAEVAVDKLQMTRFEAEAWGVSPGSGQVLLEAPWGKLGVAICYDAEFPLIARRLAAAGAEVLAVPSCTDALPGYHRVRTACQARALENQLAVVQAPTVGAAPWSPAVDANVGAAGVFTPPDHGLPADGVLALGAMNEPGWVFAELDLAALARVRADGTVRVARDWDLPGHLTGQVAVRSLVG